jgi:hypothetical protein
LVLTPGFFGLAQYDFPEFVTHDRPVGQLFFLELGSHACAHMPEPLFPRQTCEAQSLPVVHEEPSPPPRVIGGALDPASAPFGGGGEGGGAEASWCTIPASGAPPLVGVPGSI